MWSVALLLAVLQQPVGSLPVPFVAQDEDTCGAAALAMVLRYYGRDASQERIAAELLEPELRGIRGSRLAELARRDGMVAIAFAGDLPLLREHLAKGRPLVLAIAQGRGRFHDVVVIGSDEARREWIVNDPAEGPGRRLSESELDRRWKASGYWTLLVQPVVEAPAPGAGLPPPSTPPAPPPNPVPPLPADASYDTLVAGAVALGRDGAEGEAALALERAIRLDPERPEAWTERGGLRFLAGRYEEAASDLQRSLSLREDAYTRDLLGSALHLGGRELAALAAWNPNGKPTLGVVEIQGLRHTRDPVARREVALAPGATLTPASLWTSRRRLEETGVFDRVTLRTRPHGDGVADLEVALAERHGFAPGILDFALTTGVNLAWQRLRLRYSNLGGTGVSLGGALRWQENRPEASAQLQWPRPGGLPGVARLAVFAGEQGYDLGSAFELRRAGLDAGARFVLDGGSVLAVGFRIRERNPSRAHPAAASGRSVGLDAGVERRLVDTRRQRLDGSLRAQAAGALLGSELEYVQADVQLRYEGLLSRPEGRSVERSLLALRLRGGWASRSLPLDEMYTPGVSPEGELPLRAHPLTHEGVIGRNPVGRSLLLANVEWRLRLLHRTAFDVGVVSFCDAARVGRAAAGSSSASLVDVGVGVRLSLLGGATLRVDHAWGLSDQRRALFIGMNQAF